MCNCINCIKVKLIIKYRATKRLEVKIPKGGTKERESVARGGIRDNLGERDENQVGSGRNRQEKSRVKFLGFDKEGRTILKEESEKPLGTRGIDREEKPRRRQERRRQRENNPLETVLIKKRKEKKKTIDLGNELVD